MMNVVAFGEALIDMMPEYAEGRPGASRPRAFIPCPGGAPANIAVAVGRLRGSATFLGKVANDFFGDLIVDALRSYGVDTAHVVRTDEGPTALAFVAHDTDGERRFSFYRHDTADLLFHGADIPDALFDPPTILHLCSNTLTEPAIQEATESLLRHARERGSLISFDVNYRDNLWADRTRAPDAIWRCLRQAHVVKMSREELEALYGDRPEDMTLQRLLDDGVRLLVTTDGGHPVHYATASHRGTVAPPRVEVVDTTAAGDAFVGGLLTRLAAADVGAGDIDEWVTDTARVEEALRFASRCGAWTAGRFGAYDALPTPGDVAGSD
ncbi:MAG TPA: carbohydrate kinase [Gammaproteobacteria bacterium]|nr:carbohydrate kinase [Gammaproteobacteria bacterium]